jgi:hypothetical protein
VARAAADPELRDVATNALAILGRVSKDGQEAAAQPEAAKATPAVRWGCVASEACGAAAAPPALASRSHAAWSAETRHARSQLTPPTPLRLVHNAPPPTHTYLLHDRSSSSC